MRPILSQHKTSMRGMTVLDVIAIVVTITVLLVVLLPSIHVPRDSGRVRATQRVVSQLAAAIERYHEVHGTIPPDWIPRDTTPIKFDGYEPAEPNRRKSFCSSSPVESTAEALFYYLCALETEGGFPFVCLGGGLGTTDLNENGMPEFIDAWGRPILYDRRPFDDELGYDCPDSAGPVHNPKGFDLYAIRPDRETDRIEVIEPSRNTLRRFNAEAMKTYGASKRPNVIGNW